MAPLFVHDPRRGSSLSERFSLDGNPDVDKPWTTSTLEYVDADGNPQLMTTPLTPAEFALGEVRFKKQFKKLAAGADANAVPIAEYIELDPAARAGKVPFVYATDDNRRLIKVACGAGVVALVGERQRYWQTLQFLAGQGQAQVAAEYRKEIADLKARYDEEAALREASLDDIARAMSDLAASSKAPVGLGAFGAPAAASAPAPAAAAASAPVAVALADRPVYLDPADVPLCNDCGTCYQDLPQFFEKTTQIIDGAARTVAQMIPGALDGVEITPDLKKRIDRVKSTCDAEIIK
jgi:pyruvate-ferredoxin/flavodoxin oxidoreductase